jgi:hypothetical protein
VLQQEAAWRCDEVLIGGYGMQGKGVKRFLACFGGHKDFTLYNDVAYDINYSVLTSKHRRRS